jgi:hypothetical protein
MFGGVTALVGWIYVGEVQGQKHAAHMLQRHAAWESHRLRALRLTELHLLPEAEARKSG